MDPHSLRRAAFPLAAALAATLLASGCAQPEPDVEPTPPGNVVMIVIDTLRADHLGCYGYGRATSPRIDALAEQGVLFEDVVSQSSWTLPSMIAFMSGRYVFASLPTLPPAQPTLAEEFQEAGYTTAAFVGNEVVGREEHFDRGFDEYMVGVDFLEGNDRSHRLMNLESGDVLVDHALAWADKALEEPYFLYVHFIDPHLPYLTSEGYADFDGSDPIEPAVAARYRETVAKVPALGAELKKDKQRIRYTVDQYDGEIVYVDECVGKLLDGLEERGVMDNTYVALTADHGESLHERVDRRPGKTREERIAGGLTSYFRLGHGKELYDELIHIPLIITGPDVVNGRRVDDTVAAIDFMPTVLDLADIDPSGELDGTTLSPRLHEGNAALVQRSEFFTFCEEMSGVVTTDDDLKLMRHTLARNKPSTERWLFDLTADPWESTDLLPSADDELRARVDDLATRLAEREAAARLELSDSAGYSEKTKKKLRELGYIK